MSKNKKDVKAFYLNINQDVYDKLVQNTSVIKERKLTQLINQLLDSYADTNSLSASIDSSIPTLVNAINMSIASNLHSSPLSSEDSQMLKAILRNSIFTSKLLSLLYQDNSELLNLAQKRTHSSMMKILSSEDSSLDPLEEKLGDKFRENGDSNSPSFTPENYSHNTYQESDESDDDDLAIDFGSLI